MNGSKGCRESPNHWQRLCFAPVSEHNALNLRIAVDNRIRERSRASSSSAAQVPLSLRNWGNLGPIKKGVSPPGSSCFNSTSRWSFRRRVGSDCPGTAARSSGPAGERSVSLCSGSQRNRWSTKHPGRSTVQRHGVRHRWRDEPLPSGRGHPDRRCLWLWKSWRVLPWISPNDPAFF